MTAPGGEKPMHLRGLPHPDPLLKGGGISKPRS